VRKAYAHSRGGKYSGPLVPENILCWQKEKREGEKGEKKEKKEKERKKERKRIERKSNCTNN
jgi:hypothetical protein